MSYLPRPLYQKLRRALIRQEGYGRRVYDADGQMLIGVGYMLQAPSAEFECSLLGHDLLELKCEEAEITDGQIETLFTLDLARGINSIASYPNSLHPIASFDQWHQLPVSSIIIAICYWWATRRTNGIEAAEHSAGIMISSNPLKAIAVTSYSRTHAEFIRLLSGPIDSL